MATSPQLRFQYGRHANGEWYWHLRSRNGRIVAQGEGYKKKNGVLGVYQVLRSQAATALLIQVI